MFSRAGFMRDRTRLAQRWQDGRSGTPPAYGGLAATGGLFEPAPSSASRASARVDILVDPSTIAFGQNPEDSHPRPQFRVAALQPNGKTRNTLENLDCTREDVVIHLPAIPAKRVPMEGGYASGSRGGHLLSVTYGHSDRNLGSRVCR